MHPVERLRHLARAGPLEHGVLVRESAVALGALGADAAGLVLACRRLLQHHPASGPLRWLCARVLCSDEPRHEAWRCVEEIDDDPTAHRLGVELPEAATVVVLGWPELTTGALTRRADVRPLVVDSLGEGAQLARQLRGLGNEAEEVDEGGTGAAVMVADLVVLEAAAVGPDAFVAVSGSRAAACVARHAGLLVWLVAGVGRALPSGLWSSLAAGLADDEPWLASEEIVPLDLVDVVVCPSGLLTPAELRATPVDCPDAPELL
ncbi:MAG: hypothetical protein M3535_06195 [Actinomycetota bacterium]|nr:hypothetical protein [Actinomycetota bacterium]